MVARPNESLDGTTVGISSAVAITPNDGTEINRITRGIYIGGAGNLAVVFCDDPDAAPVTLTGLAAGVWHPMQVRRVMATNTTATLILAGY
jgi:hypothetical protein